MSHLIGRLQPGDDVFEVEAGLGGDGLRIDEAGAHGEQLGADVFFGVDPIPATALPGVGLEFGELAGGQRKPPGADDGAPQER
ncbi:hypothetical protein EG878_17545 [Enterococcus faecalis]|nr:hypothetical protein EG878_17545 [Enterococcus faecalis]